jgi:HSP20 family protein
MLITRTDPFHPLRAFDRTFDELMSSAFRPSRVRRPGPFAFDASWQDGSLVVGVDLPGVPDEAIGVSVADRTLTVQVTRPGDGEGTTEERSIRLGSALDPSGVTAVYRYGRLTITVPAAQRPEARNVPIEVVTSGAGEQAPAIETEATVATPTEGTSES